MATGTGTLTYQWKKSGAAIGGATAASYTTPATTTSESGTQFTVVVTDSTASRDQQCRDSYGDGGSCRAIDHDAAGEQDRYRRTNGDVQRDGDGHGATYLSMEEERRGHQRRNLVLVHDAGDDGFG